MGREAAKSADRDVVDGGAGLGDDGAAGEADAGREPRERSAGGVGSQGSGSCEVSAAGGECEGVETASAAVGLEPGEGVAFLSDRGEGLEWFVVSEIGSPPRRLTDAVESFEWSIDRSRVAYAGAVGLVVINADGTDRRVLARGAVSSPSWSPQGTEIAYESRRGGSNGLEDGVVEIFVVGVDGSDARMLVRGQRPRWSPDGSRVMYDAPVGCCDSSGDELWATSILELSSGEVNTIGGDFGEGHIGRVEALWSPDGEKVAYNHKNDVFLLRIGAEMEDPFMGGWTGQRLVVDARAESWSPDGLSIAYSAPRAADCAEACDDLWIIDATYADGAHRMRVADLRYGAGFEWSPDGESIVFSVHHPGGGGRVVSVVASSGEQEQMTVPQPESSQPSWSPDSSRIAFSSEKVEGEALEGDADIYAVNADGTGLVALTQDAHRNIMPTWVRLSLP